MTIFRQNRDPTDLETRGASSSSTSGARGQGAIELVRPAVLLGRAGRARLVEHVRSDPLLQNSFFIMLTTATMALLGLLFWVLNARLFDPAQIGVATILISATSLISYLSLLGFNSTFVRFLPQSLDRDGEINTGLWLVFGAALIVSTGYVLLVPALAPKLDFVRNSLFYAVGFVVLTAFSAVNLLTDSVFVAYRAARYNFVVDGLIQGSAKLALPVVFVGLGAFGIFLASGTAAFVGVVFSLLFMARPFGYRPEFGIRWRVIRGTLTYSSANYLSDLLNLAPLLALPIIVIDGRGAAQAGYYFVAFQLGGLVNGISYAVCRSLFAEGSYSGADLGRLAARSARILTVALVPAAVLLISAGPWLLRLFGPEYSHYGSRAVIVFGLAVPAVALNTWTASFLKLTRQLSVMIWSNVVYVAVIAGLAFGWVHRGLAWVALAWLIGNAVTGVAAGAALWARSRRLPLSS